MSDFTCLSKIRCFYPSLTQENVHELTEKMLTGTTYAYRVYILGLENLGGLFYRMSKLLNIFSSFEGHFPS